MLVCDPGDHRVLEQLSPLGEGAPCLGENAKLVVGASYLRLLEVGVQLNLVDDGNDLRGVAQPAQVVRLEVGDTYRADLPVEIELLHGPPCVDVEIPGRRRPVDEVEIEYVEPEAFPAGGERRHRGVVALVAVPELGGHEHRIAVESRIADRRTDAGLVVVDRRSVDVAVARLERHRHGGLRLVSRHLKHAVAELWDLDAVVADEVGDLSHCASLARDCSPDGNRTVDRLPLDRQGVLIAGDHLERGRLAPPVLELDPDTIGTLHPPTAVSFLGSVRRRDAEVCQLPVRPELEPVPPPRRRERIAFPPARGRDGFEFGPDGELTYLGIAPADGTQEAHGRWRVESPDRVRIEFQDGRSEPSTFEVVSCDEDTLTIKR